MRDRANVFSIALIFLFLILTLVTASAKEIVVDSNSNGDLRTIQGAVSSSFPGDTIIVRSGSYKENVVVNIPRLTIRPESENGVIVESLKENESVFLVKADNVNISGFRIIGSKVTLNSPNGIRLEDVNNCIIKGNIFPENLLGVSILNASSNTISENTFLNNVTSPGDGGSSAISLGENSGKNNLTGNTIENGYIELGPGSSENSISGNEILNGGGIVLACCGVNNIIFDNTIFNCSRGIDVYDQKVHISNNRIDNCLHGIELYLAGGSRIKHNMIVNCSIGVNLGESCSGIELSDNIIISSTEYGIFIPDYEGNEKVYNNYLNNTQNVRVGISEGNTWNISRMPGVNIVGDPYIGGNFWAKPDRTGFSQISADSNRDGIGDLTYKINENEFDYLPLVSLSTPENPVLPVSNENGMNSSFNKIIVKGPSDFVANFSANPTSGNAPLLVQFTDSSQNTTGRNWNFGDGNTSSEPNPSHTYYEARNYTVNLTVWNENNTSSKTLDIIVNEALKEKVLPVANFNTTPVTGNAPLLVQFTDLSQNTGERNWNFGDGNTSNETNPSHTYFVAGTYSVNLTVSNANGTDSATQEIIVNEAPIEETVLPEAYFSIAPASGYAPLLVQFNDLSQNITGRNWDFGDGNTSSEANPSHTYYVARNYIVNLTVSNANGTDSAIQEIIVSEAPTEEKVLPIANFSANTTTGNAPLSVQFTDLSQNITGRNWNFGDGNTSVDQNPAHNYLKSGQYIVNLTVTNENGTNSKTLLITVYEISLGEKVLPVANFNANPTSGNAPLSVQFTDLSQNATSWSWDFSNDGIADSNAINPVYTYNSQGAYTVNLIVSNANGTANKSAIINVLDGSNSGGSGGGSSSSSSSGGGSGGGGAGGSPELQSNVETKELSQAFVTSGSSIRFDFPRNVTSVLYINFNAKKTAGKTTTIVEMLKGKSTLVSQLPSGEVYKSLNIWVGNSGFATPNNIENAIVCFKVEKSWMRDKGVNQSSITLDRYSDNKWNSLPTTLLGEDGSCFYFTAQTPGFSPFAINSNTIAKGNVLQIQPAAETKMQPDANASLVQGSTVSGTAQNSNVSSDQKSAKGKTSNLAVFVMICMIALFLIAFLFKVDKKP